MNAGARVADGADDQAERDRFLPLLLVQAAAFSIATLMTLPIVFAVQATMVPDHYQEWALAADSFGYRVARSARSSAVVDGDPDTDPCAWATMTGCTR